MIRHYKVAMFMAILVISSLSCKKDDPVKEESVVPEYAGTWESIESNALDNGNNSIKNILTFTETSFQKLGQMQVSTDTWANLRSLKGSMLVIGNTMNVSVTEVGVSTFSLGLPTGQITSYHEGSADFVDQLVQTGQPALFKSTYSISGNLLTFKMDINEDGDYLDNNETTVYTRQ